MFLTIHMHKFGWLSERGGGGGEGCNFLNLFQKEGGTQKGVGSLRKGVIPTLEETMLCLANFENKI